MQKRDVALQGGSPSFTAVDGTLANAGATLTNASSIISYEIAATTISGCQYRINLSLGASGTEEVDLTPQDLFIAPGEQMTITGTGTGNSTVGF